MFKNVEIQDIRMKEGLRMLRSKKNECMEIQDVRLCGTEIVEYVRQGGGGIWPPKEKQKSSYAPHFYLGELFTFDIFT